MAVIHERLRQAITGVIEVARANPSPEGEVRYALGGYEPKGDVSLVMGTTRLAVGAVLQAIHTPRGEDFYKALTSMDPQGEFPLFRLRHEGSYASTVARKLPEGQRPVIVIKHELERGVTGLVFARREKTGKNVSFKGSYASTYEEVMEDFLEFLATDVNDLAPMQNTTFDSGTVNWYRRTLGVPE